MVRSVAAGCWPIEQIHPQLRMLPNRNYTGASQKTKATTGPQATREVR
ncbi:MAG: hypothetical protein K8T91_26585 [Planctomycetes bacterium]|nr:hypothetical protein [Planctomycetota bacterium]